MSDGQTAGVPIHIDAGTIEESIQRTLDEAYANVPDGHYELRRALFTEAKAQSEIAQTYSRVLQLVLYLCAQNNYLISQLRPCPSPAYITCNPWAGSGYGGCGCNQGCGC